MGEGVGSPIAGCFPAAGLSASQARMSGPKCLHNGREKREVSPLRRKETVANSAG